MTSRQYELLLTRTQKMAVGFPLLVFYSWPVHELKAANASDPDGYRIEAVCNEPADSGSMNKVTNDR